MKCIYRLESGDTVILKNLNLKRQELALPSFNEDLDGVSVMFLEYEDIFSNGLYTKACRVMGIKCTRNRNRYRDELMDISEFLVPVSALCHVV